MASRILLLLVYADVSASKSLILKLANLLETALCKQHREPVSGSPYTSRESSTGGLMRRLRPSQIPHTSKKLVQNDSGATPGSYPWCWRHPPATTVQVLPNLISWHILHQFLLLLQEHLLRLHIPTPITHLATMSNQTRSTVVA